MPDFYDGNKLLSLLDENRRPPELYFICGNRTAGKTFYCKRYMLRRFVRFKEKFVIFVRFKDDIPQTVDGFFADIGPIAFPGHTMSQRPLLQGKAAELLYDDRPCGYVVAINASDSIKKNSAIFADAARGFLDEFMSEVGKYVPNEIIKFNSLRISIARGGARGVHARRFPVLLCSNNVTVLNPYFEYFGITQRIQNKTRYLRGPGWVLEQTFNRTAADAIRSNFRTISGKELDYATSNEYLLDTKTFVSKMPGRKACACEIRYENRKYTVWGGMRQLWFVSAKLKASSTLIIALDNKSHSENSVLVTRSHPLFKTLRKAYESGNMRFESQGCKQAFLAAMSLQDK